MFSIFFIFLTISFLLFWFSRSFIRKKNKSAPLKNSSDNKNISFKSELNVSNLSKFQKWLLDSSNTNDPNQLPKSLKSAYFSNDWHELEPSDYAKWSKFHWGI
tara:strand:+ start:582 stop:890 length:309 start_codon:yes stop_codon:yes gene_type:complete